jgi:hypothetical protein
MVLNHVGHHQKNGIGDAEDKEPVVITRFKPMSMQNGIESPLDSACRTREACKQTKRTLWEKMESDRIESIVQNAYSNQHHYRHEYQAVTMTCAMIESKQLYY